MANEMFNNPQAVVQQVMSAVNSLSDSEASARYQQILAKLPPDQAAQLNALAMTQVNQEQRRDMATQFRQAHNDPNSPFDGYDYDDDDAAASPQNLGQLSARAQQQDPSILGGLFGKDSPLGGTLGKAALAALAAMLIRRMMSGEGSGQRTPQAADPIGAILGGLLGGGGGMAQSADPIGAILGGLLGGGAAAQTGGDPIGAILGGLLGGGGPVQGLPQRGQQAPQGGGAIDLGSILGSVLSSGQQAPQRGGGGGGVDLGSILGSILGGAAGSASGLPGSGSHRREPGLHPRNDD